MNIVQKIEKAHYVATEHDVELLAAEHLANVTAANHSDGSYLRILIAAMQSQFGSNGRKRKLTATDQAQHIAQLATIHGRLYPHVLKGVTTPEVVEDETLDPDTRRARAAIRNNRAGFARSAASTLKAWVLAGGDVRGLDIGTTTKTELRAFTRAHVDPAGARRDPAHAATVSLVTRLRTLATTDPDAARVSAEEAMQELQKVLDELEEAPKREGQHVESGVFQGRRGAAYRQRTATA